MLAEPRRIIIRENKRLPFTALETATFELALGQGAAVSEAEGSTIPSSWQGAYETLKQVQAKPVVAMVVGGVDSGKSSFVTYLANRLVGERCRVAVMDEDLGQSDIGPPATVGYTVFSKPVTDLFTAKPETVIFVGATSPSAATDSTLQAVQTLKMEIQTQAKADYLIVNTDGWTNGDEAVMFKMNLAQALKPSVAFCLQRRGEPAVFCGVFTTVLPELKVCLVEAPPRVRERDREKRKSLRELGFIKHLAGAKPRVYLLSHVAVVAGGRAVALRPQDAQDLLVGLHDARRKFLGIGVVRGVDAFHRTVRVLTAVEEKPAVLVLGNVRLDESLREIQ